MEGVDGVCVRMEVCVGGGGVGVRWGGVEGVWVEVGCEWRGCGWRRMWSG